MSPVRRAFRRALCLASVVALVAVFGCEAPPPTGPGATADPGPAFATVGGPASVDIVSFADGTTVMGAASLTRTRNHVTLRAHMRAEHGETFTVWAVVFNKPDECAGVPCGIPDLFNPDVMANVIRIAGGIAGGDGLHVSGTLREGDDSEGLFPGAPPLMDAMAAELHFIYRSHGQKIAGEIDDQIMDVFGGCETNVCEDLAFSVHLP